MNTDSGRPRTTIVALLLTAAAFYGVFIFRSSFPVKGGLYFTLIDDAMVSMRYAQHLAQGFGLVWNIGEKPVEGFTNPGWVLIMAVLHWFPIATSKISLGVMVVSAIGLLANAVVIYRICGAIHPEAKFAPIVACAITAFYFPLVFWSLRGMEVGLLALLVNLGLLTALRWDHGGGSRNSVLLGVIFVMALAVRLDSLLQVSVILIYLLSIRKPHLNRAIIPLALVLIATIGILVWQRAYFGDFLPNTYYQKVVGASALERIKNGLLAFNQHATRDTLAMALLSAGGIVWYRAMRSREIALLVALFLVQCLYSIWVGGDYAEPEVDAANRFITQGMPALIILFSLTADRIVSDVMLAGASRTESSPGLHAGVSIGIACAVLIVISGEPWVNWAIDNAPLLKADVRRVKVGLSIAEYTSPAAVIAVHAAGQIPYYSGRKAIDLLGLNDPVIARGPVIGTFYPGHDKWNYDYSIGQLKPDLIADNWIRLGDYMKSRTDYAQLDNGMYVRKDSVLLDVAGLSQP